MTGPSKRPWPQAGRVDVVCGGDPREMGLAQGEDLRERIVAARASLSELEAFRLLRPRWMPYRVFRRLAERKAAGFLARALLGPADVFGPRLAGIAEGANLRPPAICLLNALEPVLSSIKGNTEVPALGACSAVAVRGRRSATGEPIIARNFDYLPLVQPFYVVREDRPEGGLRSLIFTLAPLGGAVDGINERGLCIAYNYAFVTEQARAAPPISMIVAEMLARCGTVADAARWITSRPRCGAGLLMMADASGDICSLELSNTRSHLRRPAGGEDFLFHSNAYTAGTMREIEVSHEAVYTGRAPAPLRGRRVLQSADVRDRRFAELLGKPSRLGPDELAVLMADHGPAVRPGDDTICMHGGYWYTTACLQLFPQARRIRIAFASACRARFAALQL